MKCKYKIGSTVYNSYQELLNSITDDEIKDFAAVIFSLDTVENLYDKLKSLSHEYTITHQQGAFMDDADVDAGKNFTTQTFIDSGYFLVNGNPPMFRMDFDDYTGIMRARLVKEGFTEEQAKRTVELQKANWETIAKDATTLHKIVVSSSSTDSDRHFSGAALNTPFQAVYDKLRNVTKEVEKQVLKTNGGSQLMKNLNITAKLRGLAEDIVGHIDYLCIRDDGTIDIYNLAVSTESESDWAGVKKEKYKYKLALLKRILEYNGINARDIRVNLVPIKIKYNETFDSVQDIQTFSPKSYDMNDSKYTMQPYDNVVANFIDSNNPPLKVDDSDLINANIQLNKIFPNHSVEITTQGIKESARGWVKSNWKVIAKPAEGKRGWDITFPGEKESIYIPDTRIGENNKELIDIVSSREEELFNSTPAKKATYRVVADIKQAYKQKLPAFYCSLKNSSFIQNQLNKYFESSGSDENGKPIYKWRLINNDTLTNANLLLFENIRTHQLDIVAITPFDVSTKVSYKGRENLLGSYLPDVNNRGFLTPSNYGNIEATRTMVVLNQVLPKLPFIPKLGTLKVVGISSYHNKKGCEMDIQQFLPVFNTIVEVTNENNQELKMKNNFKGVKTIDPADLLIQTWREALAEHPEVNELKELESDIVDHIKTNGTILAGLESTGTVEGKITKLETIIDKIQNLNRLPKDPKRIQQALYSTDPYLSTLAKVYTAALHALNMYNGDLNIENEAFSSLNEYLSKPQSIANSNVRTITQMFQQSITTIADTMIKEYSPLRQIMQEYFKAKNYGAVRNSLIGDEARIFNNLYELDSQGEKTMRFKNPYDPNAQLDAVERKFLKEVLFEINKIRYQMRGQTFSYINANDSAIKEAIKTSNWLDVPLQKASAATRRLKTKSSMINSMKNLYKRLMHPKEAFEEFSNNLLTEQDKDEISSAIRDLQVYNPYTRSEDTNRRTNWLTEKGVDYFETNVENILIDFMEKHIQSIEYKKMLTRTSGVLLDLYIKGETEDDSKNMYHTIKTINDFLTTAVYNQSIMEPTSKAIETYVEPVRKLISKMYIAGNFVGSVRDTVQGFYENIARGINKYQTNISAEDVLKGYKEVILEGPQNIMAISKLNQLNLKYRLSNMDIAKISEGQKTCRGGILNWESWAYSTLYGPDYLNRLVLFSAQMHHDGVNDAYYIKDKQLVYDWAKDKRFTKYVTNDTSDIQEYNKQRSLYLSLLRMFNQERNLQLKEGDALPDAYTNIQITSFKNMADSIYGAYNQSTKAKYENIAIGRNFAVFSTWMNGMVDTYIKKTQLSNSQYHAEQETRDGQQLYWNKFGEAVTLEEGGDENCPVFKYVPDVVQGILYTLQSAFKEYHYNGKEGFIENIWHNSAQRANLNKLLSDLLAALLVATIMSSAMGAAYAKFKKNADPANLATNAIAEILFKGTIGGAEATGGPIQGIKYLANSTNPAALRTTFGIYDSMWKLFSGQKSIAETAFNAQASLRSIQDSFKLYYKEYIKE